MQFYHIYAYFMTFFYLYMCIYCTWLLYMCVYSILKSVYEQCENFEYVLEIIIKCNDIYLKVKFLKEMWYSEGDYFLMLVIERKKKISLEIFSIWYNLKIHNNNETRVNERKLMKKQ